MRIEEFDPEKKWWQNRRKNDFAWKVSIDEIKVNGYNLDVKNPNNGDMSRGDPDKLLTEYKMLLSDITESCKSLKQELIAALGGNNV